MSRTVPVQDESQDWQLVSGQAENGHTILEFKRHLTTCDDKDMDISVSTKFHMLHSSIKIKDEIQYYFRQVLPMYYGVLGIQSHQLL